MIRILTILFAIQALLVAGRPLAQPPRLDVVLGHDDGALLKVAAGSDELIAPPSALPLEDAEVPIMQKRQQFPWTMPGDIPMDIRDAVRGLLNNVGWPPSTAGFERLLTELHGQINSQYHDRVQLEQVFRRLNGVRAVIRATINSQLPADVLPADGNDQGQTPTTPAAEETPSPSPDEQPATEAPTESPSEETVPTSTEEAATPTEAPASSTEEVPTSTEQPFTEEVPTSTEQPSTTEQPAEQPSSTEQPPPTEQPTSTEQPSTTEQPFTTEQPSPEPTEPEPTPTTESQAPPSEPPAPTTTSVEMCNRVGPKEKPVWVPCASMVFTHSPAEDPTTAASEQPPPEPAPTPNQDGKLCPIPNPSEKGGPPLWIPCRPGEGETPADTPAAAPTEAPAQEATSASPESGLCTQGGMVPFVVRCPLNAAPNITASVDAAVKVSASVSVTTALPSSAQSVSAQPTVSASVIATTSGLSSAASSAALTSSVVSVTEATPTPSAPSPAATTSKPAKKKCPPHRRRIRVAGPALLR
ncbi:hypothetical protein Q8F55_001610 [Vanrija albida]|uniref:Uncharacterized protein n=1 Tax=Vanrija albida TaxID=181172 RepID=A0ABR3QGJ3_9TREE